MKVLLEKIQVLFRQIVTKVEENPAGVGAFARLFVAFLVIRLTLEFFSNQKLFSLDDIVHIGLWFVFIVLAFVLQLHLFSGQSVAKAAKLAITFFSISFSAPLLDLLFFRGKGVEMNYLSLQNFSDILFSYLSMGGTNLRRGATLGIRMEIILLVLSCFYYIYLKQKSVLRAFLGSWSIYTVLFLSGTVPFFLNFGLATFHLPYHENSQSTILLLLLIDTILLGVIAIRYLPNLLDSLKPLNLYRSALSILIFAIGAYQARTLYPQNWIWDSDTIFYLPLLSLAGLAFHFLFRIKTGSLSEHFSFLPSILLGFVLMLSFAISYKIAFAFLGIWAFYYVVEEAPLRLVEVPVIGTMIRALGTSFFALLGFSCFGGVMVGFPALILLGIYLLSLLSSFVLKD